MKSKTLPNLAAHYSTAPLFLTTPDSAKEVNGSVMSANFFPLLGLSPALGRFFRPDEDRVPDRDRVAADAQAEMSALTPARWSHHADLRNDTIRASIGAGRGRLIRQLPTESVLLSCLGGVAGLSLSTALTNALKAMFFSMDSEGHPLWYDFSLEPAISVAGLLVSRWCRGAAGFNRVTSRSCDYVRD
jgi:hypothetical protein